MVWGIHSTAWGVPCTLRGVGCALYRADGVGHAKGTVATSRAQAPAAEDRRPHAGIVTSGLEGADAERWVKTTAIGISFPRQGVKTFPVRGSQPAGMC